MMKIVLLAALVGAAFACSPNQPYVRQYQAMHRDNACVQCQGIVAESECSNNWHDAQFGCATPVVNYGLGPQGCAQASIMCPARGAQQSTMLVALLDNSDGRFGPDARVYAPISDVQGAYARASQQCGMGSQWGEYSMDDFPLAQPLTIQCAANAPGFVLPPVSERYQQFMRRQEFHPRPAVTTTQRPIQAPVQAQRGYEVEEARPRSVYVAPQQTSYVAPQQTSYVAPQQSYEQTDAARVVNEDVREEILGTTLIPVVKERVVQNVIKEVHNYPIQKKRIIKTRRISKPIVSQREVVERVPATRIVPTFEEIRRIEQIRGTTIEPIVEAFEVTEMLPAIYTPAPYQQAAQQRYVAPAAPVEYGQPSAVIEERREEHNVQPSGYDNQESRPYSAPPAQVQQTGNAGGYEAPRPEEQQMPGSAVQRPEEFRQQQLQNNRSQQPKNFPQQPEQQPEQFPQQPKEQPEQQQEKFPKQPAQFPQQPEQQPEQFPQQPKEQPEQFPQQPEQQQEKFPKQPKEQPEQFPQQPQQFPQQPEQFPQQTEIRQPEQQSEQFPQQPERSPQLPQVRQPEQQSEQFPQQPEQSPHLPQIRQPEQQSEQFPQQPEKFPQQPEIRQPEQQQEIRSQESKPEPRQEQFPQTEPQVEPAQPLNVEEEVHEAETEPQPQGIVLPIVEDEAPAPQGRRARH